MTSPDVLRDIGEVLTWATRPRVQPARDEAYTRLVRRYRSEPDFAEATDAVLAGAGLSISVDDIDGFTVIATSDSPLRTTVSDLSRRLGGDPGRSVVGLVILTVARLAYPHPSMLDDPGRIAVFTTNDVVAALDRAVAEVGKDAPDASADEGLLEAWRRWDDMPEARANQVRRSIKDRSGLVARVCGLLVDAGHLTQRSETDGGTWISRPRFRHAVAALAEDSDLYAALHDLAGPAPEEEEAP